LNIRPLRPIDEEGRHGRDAVRDKTLRNDAVHDRGEVSWSDGARGKVTPVIVDPVARALTSSSNPNTDPAAMGGMGMGGMGMGGIGSLSQTVTTDTVPLGEIDARRGDQVEAIDGDIGRVRGLVINPARLPRHHVLLQAGHLWGRKDVAIPISAVTRVDDGIRLNITKQQVKDLRPVYIDLPTHRYPAWTPRERKP